MFLLEHDAKTLLAAHGVRSPAGCLIERSDALGQAELPPGPWVVKAQVPVGGRGKAGFVRLAERQAELASLVDAMLGAAHRGHRVGACRVEARSVFCHEAYLSFMPDPESGRVRVLLAARGGVDIESSDAVRSIVADGEVGALGDAVSALAAEAPPVLRSALRDAGGRLAQAFLALDALLLEVNPLFVTGEGEWTAGDAKMVIDDNALFRQPEVQRLLEARRHAYPEAYTKFKHGFDYVVVDPDGELGLLTTGAGLSMMLIDELRPAGIRPYNFLDVRTGGLRGDATRLVQVLAWIAQGRNVKCVLVNVFAGITDLGELARLLVEAIGKVPELRVPVITRLVGNGLDEARSVLAESGIAVEPDLNRALALVGSALARTRHAQR